MEQFAQKRGYASLRYDQSSTGQTTGVKREDVSWKNKSEKYSNYTFHYKKVSLNLLRKEIIYV